MTDYQPGDLRIAARSSTVEQFIAAFARYVTRESIFVPTRSTREVGTEHRFAVVLSDGTPVLVGAGTVVASWASVENPFQRPGVKLRLKMLSSRSVAVFKELLGEQQGLTGRAASGTSRPPASAPPERMPPERMPPQDATSPSADPDDDAWTTPTSVTNTRGQERQPPSQPASADFASEESTSRMAVPDLHGLLASIGAPPPAQPGVPVVARPPEVATPPLAPVSPPTRPAAPDRVHARGSQMIVPARATHPPALAAQLLLAPVAPPPVPTARPHARGSQTIVRPAVDRSPTASGPTPDAPRTEPRPTPPEPPPQARRRRPPVPPPINPLGKLTDEWLEGFVESSLSAWPAAPGCAPAAPSPAPAPGAPSAPATTAPLAVAATHAAIIDPTGDLDWSAISVSSRRGYWAVGGALAVASTLLAFVLWSGPSQDRVEVPSVASSLPASWTAASTTVTQAIELAPRKRIDRHPARRSATRPRAWVCSACKRCRPICASPAPQRRSRKVRRAR